RRNLENRHGRAAALDLDGAETGITTGVMVMHSILVHEALVTGLHEPITVFRLAEIREIVWVGQPDLADCGEAVQTARPGRKVTEVVALLGRRLDWQPAVPGQYSAVVVQRLAIPRVAVQTRDEGCLVLQAAGPAG